jgi:hypothetical protein
MKRHRDPATNSSIEKRTIEEYFNRINFDTTHHTDLNPEFEKDEVLRRINSQVDRNDIHKKKGFLFVFLLLVLIAALICFIIL